MESLVKIYGDLTAVDSISFTIQKGEIFSLLGPNGAGKTTTVEILECLRKPTRGHARVFGLDILHDQRAIKQRIGVLPQEFNTFDSLTVQENLQYFAGMFGSSVDVDGLIKLVDLDDKRQEQYKKLSGGLKQRLGVAMALVNDPEIVFLDEPTAGLDPKARHAVWNVIRGLKRQGKTVFLTTHYMEEAEVLSDTVTIIHRGKIVASGSPEALITRHGQRNRLVLTNTDRAAVPLLATLGLEATFDPAAGEVTVPLNHSADVAEIVRELALKQIAFGELQLKRSTLEDVFLNLTGETLRETETQ